MIVRDETGREVARGLSRYDAGDAERIIGARSAEIEAAPGLHRRPTLIHADDLALSPELSG